MKRSAAGRRRSRRPGKIVLGLFSR